MATNKTLNCGCLFYYLYKRDKIVVVVTQKIFFAIGNEGLSDRTAEKWFKKFSKSFKSVEGANKF